MSCRVFDKIRKEVQLLTKKLTSRLQKERNPRLLTKKKRRKWLSLESCSMEQTFQQRLLYPARYWAGASRILVDTNGQSLAPKEENSIKAHTGKITVFFEERSLVLLIKTITPVLLLLETTDTDCMHCSMTGPRLWPSLETLKNE